jgi:hypothetical protein
MLCCWIYPNRRLLASRAPASPALLSAALRPRPRRDRLRRHLSDTDGRRQAGYRPTTLPTETTISRAGATCLGLYPRPCRTFRRQRSCKLEFPGHQPTAFAASGVAVEVANAVAVLVVSLLRPRRRECERLVLCDRSSRCAMARLHFFSKKGNALSGRPSPCRSVEVDRRGVGRRPADCSASLVRQLGKH